MKLKILGRTLFLENIPKYNLKGKWRLFLGQFSHNQALVPGKFWPVPKEHIKKSILEKGVYVVWSEQNDQFL